jgi:RNA polymerase sigma factor (sigma-70 family)
VEVSALKHPSLPRLRGATPLLRLADDERLIALTRRGQQAAFEAIVSRYQSRLLSFCRHMLASREDAEDVLQEVFAAAFNAILADERPINVRPWLYRIARNRCLNHLRRQTAIGSDSMDVHFADNGQSTTDKVTKREEFRLLLDDVGRLPETQRTALLLREMDSLSYEGIAEAMETTVPSVKSLLVRARVSLAEAAEARKLSCDEVRLELGAVAEGIAKASPPVRRHVKDCDRCEAFRDTLRANNRVMAAVLPVGPLLLLKKLALAKIGLSASAGSATGSGAAGAAGAGAAGATAVGASSTGAALTAGAIATKAAAGLAAAALVTVGAVTVRHAVAHPRHHTVTTAVLAPIRPPVVVASEPQPTSSPRPLARVAVKHARKAPVAVPVKPALGVATATKPATPTTQQVSASTVLPPQPPTTPPTNVPPTGAVTPPDAAVTPSGAAVTPPAAATTPPVPPVQNGQTPDVMPTPPASGAPTPPTAVSVGGGQVTIGG